MRELLMSQQQEHSVKEYERLLRECTKQRWLTGGKQIHAQICSTSPSGPILLFLANTLVRMYAECGSLAQARRLFEAMPRRNVYSWTILISAYANRRQGGVLNEPLSLFDRMVSEGVAPNQVTFLAALKSCPCLPSLRRLHDSARALGLHRNVFVATALVNTYSKCGSLEEARRVFDGIPAKSVVSWNAMISGYAQYGHQGGKLMENANCQNSAAISGHVQYGHQNIISGEHAQYGHHKDGLTNAVNSGQNRIGDHDPLIAEHVIHGSQDALIARHALHDDHDAVISGHAHCEINDALIAQHGDHVGMIAKHTHPGDRGATIDGQGHQAHHPGDHDAVIPEHARIGDRSARYALHGDHGGMNSGQPWIGVHDAGPTLHGDHDAKLPPGHAHAHAWIGDRDARHALCRDQGAPMIPEHARIGDHDAGHAHYAHCNTILAGHIRIGCHDAAHFGCDPSRSLNSMIAVDDGAQLGHCNEALALFGEMQCQGWKPDKVTFISALKASACIATLEQGKLIHATILKGGFETNDMVDSALIDMYAKCGSIEEARRVFNITSPRDVVVWTALITGYAQHGHGKRALELFQEMQLEGVKPDEVTFVSILSACRHEGLVEEARCFFDSITRVHRIELAREHYAGMVDLLCRAGHLVEAEELVDKMPIQPGASIWRSILGACELHSNIELGRRAFKHIMELEAAKTEASVVLSDIFVGPIRPDKVATLEKETEMAKARKMVG